MNKSVRTKLRQISISLADVKEDIERVIDEAASAGSMPSLPAKMEVTRLASISTDIDLLLNKIKLVCNDAK